MLEFQITMILNKNRPSTKETQQLAGECELSAQGTTCLHGEKWKMLIFRGLSL